MLEGAGERRVAAATNCLRCRRRTVLAARENRRRSTAEARSGVQRGAEAPAILDRIDSRRRRVCEDPLWVRSREGAPLTVGRVGGLLDERTERKERVVSLDDVIRDRDARSRAFAYAFVEEERRLEDYGAYRDRPSFRELLYTVETAREEVARAGAPR